MNVDADLPPVQRCFRRPALDGARGGAVEVGADGSRRACGRRRHLSWLRVPYGGDACRAISAARASAVSSSSVSDYYLVHVRYL